MASRALFQPLYGGITANWYYTTDRARLGSILLRRSGGLFQLRHDDRGRSVAKLKLLYAPDTARKGPKSRESIAPRIPAQSYEGSYSQPHLFTLSWEGRDPMDCGRPQRGEQVPLRPTTDRRATAKRGPPSCSTEQQKTLHWQGTYMHPVMGGSERPSRRSHWREDAETRRLRRPHGRRREPRRRPVWEGPTDGSHRETKGRRRTPPSSGRRCGAVCASWPA